MHKIEKIVSQMYFDRNQHAPINFNARREANNPVS